ncbi:MAG: RNA 2',3'-cyclic phosphodiesterase [Aeromicrobium sp.]
MRMFVAAYPPADVLADLGAFLEPRREHGEFRWASMDQIHLTLAFLAGVPEHAVDELVDRLARAAAKRRVVTAAIAGGGAFPSVDAAKVLWAGLDVDDAEELDRLAAGCRAAAGTAGSPPSGERFRPHLTLARVGRPIEASKWVRLLNAYRGPTWQLAEVALVASYLGEGPRKRPRHEVVEICALAT